MGGWAEQRGGGWAALSGEAVAVGSVKCDLAALLCHSGRSSVRGGEGSRQERQQGQKEKEPPPACGRDSDIRYQHTGLVLKDNSNLVEAWNGEEWDALQRFAPSRHNELNVTGVTLLFPPPS